MTWDIYFTGLHVPEPIEHNNVDMRIHHTETIKITYVPSENFHQVNTYLQKEPIIIFLSKNSVNGFHYGLETQGITLDNYSVDFMAVGEETSEAVEEKFLQPAQIPEIQNAFGLIQALQSIQKKPVMLITAEETRPELPNWLDEEGWDYCHLAVYSTTLKQNHHLQKIFKNTQNEIIIFTSPSTVLGFLKSINAANFKSINSRLVSIGSTTTRSIEEQFGSVFLESSRPKLATLTKELVAELLTNPIPQGITG